MRVCIVPEYPMSLMTGGLQVQAEETYKAVRELGGEISAELFNWSERLPLPDVYHFIGFPPHCFSIARLVERAARPYLITILLGNPEGYFGVRLAAARQFVKSQIMRQKSRYRAVTGAAALVTITDADADAAALVYGVDRRRIHVVPNGVSDGFFNASPGAWHNEYGSAPFVLCVGAIQQRKNQLSLVDACNQLQLPVVLLGSVLPGEAEYGMRVSETMAQNEKFGGRWLQSLTNADALLLSAHAACRLFVLLSSAETQPLSVMQAMAARKPILLLKAGYTRDRLFSGLPSVSSTDMGIVSAALKGAWDAAKPTELPCDYSWSAVARQLYRIYCTVAR